METVGARAPVFCLRAQGRRKAAKGPSLKDRCRARSGEAQVQGAIPVVGRR